VPTGEIKKFKLFHILEFDSTRKRNSVIVKDLQNEKYMLLTKGADSIILDRKSAENNEAILE
jgi:magnesium-transporting ATPase (P-type)